MYVLLGTLDSYSDADLLAKSYSDLERADSHECHEDYYAEDNSSSEDLLLELLRRPLETSRPLWEVQLELVSPDTSSAAANSNRSCHVILTPSADKFKEALREIFQNYEDVVCSFTPLSRDKKIKPFMRTSKYDLLMQMEQRRPDEEVFPSWPDVRSVLHDYAPYAKSVAYMEKALYVTMTEIKKLSAVSIEG